jgi:hypothetical protein
MSLIRIIWLSPIFVIRVDPKNSTHRKRLWPHISSIVVLRTRATFPTSEFVKHSTAVHLGQQDGYCGLFLFDKP